LNIWPDQQIGLNSLVGKNFCQKYAGLSFQRGGGGQRNKDGAENTLRIQGLV
jgi:hypothetical protein